MKKRIAHSTLFVLFSLVVFTHLFFVYGDMKLLHLEFLGEKLNTSEYGEIEKKISSNKKNIFGNILLRFEYEPYISHIESKLKDNNMPDDLKYIAIQKMQYNFKNYGEIGYNGMWNLDETVAKEYSMSINETIDERADFEKSTSVVLAYLARLYDQYGDRNVVVALYGSNTIAQNTELKLQDIFSNGKYQKQKTYLYDLIAHKYQ